MTRAAAATFLIVFATPAFAAGDAFEGAPWWVAALFYAGCLAVFALLAAGLGFFLQGLLQLRNAVVLMTVVSIGFLTWLATSYGLEKTVSGLLEFALCLALSSPFFGLGWRTGTRGATRQSNRKIALNSGSKHG
jgi:hypothetical protein